MGYLAMGCCSMFCASYSNESFLSFPFSAQHQKLPSTLLISRGLPNQEMDVFFECLNRRQPDFRDSLL